MTYNHKYIIGDSRQMSLVEDESVQLIITSPPYWQLKDYGSDEQIGFNDDYTSYINNLNLVWQECNRVLNKGCRLCINIGDEFARSVYYGRYKVIPIRTEIIKFCESIGLDYMGAIIWQKQTTMNTTGGGSVMGSYPYPRNGIIKIDYEFILIFKKQGIAPKVSEEQKLSSQLTKEEWNMYFSSHWNFAGAKQDGHMAVFPVELPYRLIKMFSFKGETIFDPFMGSGTTALAARMLDRNSIGYEINKDFITYYKQKMQIEQQDLLCSNEYQFLEDNCRINDIQQRISTLPYIFHDSVQIKRKINPKDLTFGNKIDGKEKEKGNYHQIKDVFSSNIVKLNNNVTLHLIGVKPKQDKTIENKAIEYILQHCKNKQVYFTLDNIKYDNNDNLYAYLYLKNKTFINAHLIKEGLCDVDNSIDYRYKTKFQNF